MAKIRVLSDHLANQIAAGEVVERPMSVVKEMLENSLDAGARRVTVDIEAGGRRLLRVVDDGEGMMREDAVLAFERHATSKLKTAEDLTNIITLGFRGEALASIAAVAKVELVTKTADAPNATKVVLEGGRVRDVRDAAHPQGTALSVRDLFFNVPARRKFLRSEATETYHISNLVTHYALARPAVAFTLTNNGREMLRITPARDLRERAYQVFGASFVETLLPVAGSAPNLAQVSGYVSVPTERRTSREAQYMFVNGRYVRDKILLKALSEGYRNTLPPGTYPAAILFLEVPLEEVDVNVHPAKTEVRFRRAAALGDIVRNAVRDALARGGYVRGDAADLVPSYVENIPEEIEPTPEPLNPQPSPLMAQHAALIAQNSPLHSVLPPQTVLPLVAPASPETPTNAAWLTQTIDSAGFVAEMRSAMPHGAELSPASETQAAPIAPDTVNGETVAQVAPAQEVTAQEGTTPENIAPEVVATVSDAPESAAQPENAALATFVSGAHLLREVPAPALGTFINPLGQLADSFIIAADSEGLLLIDQHIAHERILFARHLDREGTRNIETQRLLLPEIFDLTPAQAAVFKHVETELAACGFDVMQLSGRTVAVKAVPADLPHAEMKALLTEILDAIEKERRGSTRTEWRDQIAAKVACRAAVKANTPLAPEKLRWLTTNLLATDSSLPSPHGRSGIMRLTLKDIEKGLQKS